MDSKGDVRQFFWPVFRKPLARILLLFEAFASGFPRPDGGLETCFLWIPKVTFGSFSGLCLARILLLFEAFASGFPRPDGGLETCCFCCFLWIPKVTFGSFSGLCFASLWYESCCCLRLSQAVFQGQTEG